MRACLLAILLLLCLGACTTRDTGSTRSWSQENTTYATHFTILEHGDERRIIVLGHGGAGDTVTDFLLDKPLQRIAIISTTHASFISALGCTDRIVACAHAKDVRDRQLRAAIDSGKVKDIGTSDRVDREQLLALKPDAVLGYPFGGEGGTVESLGIPVINVSEYLEEHPLGRAEWIRCFGALLGREHEADSIFRGIVERYEAVRKSVPRDSLPTVLFGSVWQGQWWVPPGNSYMAKLIDDAGGRYLFADRTGTGNIAVDMETMITIGAQADVWGMITDTEPGSHGPELFTGGDERLAYFKAVRSNRLFFGNSRVVDLFGQALLEPDEVLNDLTQAIWSGGTVSWGRPPYWAPVLKMTPPPSSSPSPSATPGRSAGR